MLRSTLLTLTLILWPCAVNAATLKPVAAEGFFVEPDEPARL